MNTGKIGGLVVLALGAWLLVALFSEPTPAAEIRPFTSK